MPNDPTAIEVAEIYDDIVIGALKSWLVANGYDGLISEEGDCGCLAHGPDECFIACDMPYDEIEGCSAAHRVDRPPPVGWRMFKGKRPDHIRDATKKVED